MRALSSPERPRRVPAHAELVDRLVVRSMPADGAAGRPVRRPRRGTCRTWRRPCSVRDRPRRSAWTLDDRLRPSLDRQLVRGASPADVAGPTRQSRDRARRSAALPPASTPASACRSPAPTPPRGRRGRLVIVVRPRLWSLVDPTGEAHAGSRRLVGDATRRVARAGSTSGTRSREPDATTQGDPTVGRRSLPRRIHRSARRTPRSHGASVGRTAGRARPQRQVEATLTARIIGAWSACSGAGRARHERRDRRRSPSSTWRATLADGRRGDEAAASAADGLSRSRRARVRAVGGRVVSSSTRRPA